MDIGVRKAGFKVLAQVEMDKHCCGTLRAARMRDGDEVRIYEADIRGMDPQALASDLGLAPMELDLLFAGPPCQPFSAIGKQNGLADPKGLLLFEALRFAESLKPRVVFLEQVKGLLSAKGVDGKRGGVFGLLLSELRSIGYNPMWQLCCAADYGVPQLRKRVFIVASREGGGFRFPERTHADLSHSLNISGLLPYRTAGQALSGLGEPFVRTKGAALGRDDSHVDVTPPRDRERIAQVPEGSYLAAQTHLDASLRGSLKPKDTTKYLRLDRGRPSNTLRCGEIFYHPVEDRYLTPRECMRLHGYDDSYMLCGPIRARTGTVRSLDQHRQVANSVPPPLAYAIGAEIRRHLDGGAPPAGSTGWARLPGPGP
jgi:DNA (cytosine-5)-methyltransferase 1